MALFVGRGRYAELWNPHVALEHRRRAAEDDRLLLSQAAGREGMSAAVPAKSHVPVLLDEVVAALAPAPGETHVDGTFGAGGYTQAILSKGVARVFAFDRDPEAIQYGETLAASSGGRLTLVPERFSRMRQALADHGVDKVDGVTLDIGVSSMQLDQAERGFSFQADGPADMRMSAGRARAPPTSSTMPTRTQIADVLFHYGEEPKSRRVARAIVAARPIERTGQLADVVRKALGHHPGMKKDPATRTFQAIRIHVNQELAELEGGLAAAERVLAARRPPRRRHLSQPRGPDREALPEGAQRRAARGLAPPPGGERDGAGGDLRGGRQGRPPRRGGTGRQSAGPVRHACGPRAAPPRRPGT